MVYCRGADGHVITMAVENVTEECWAGFRRELDTMGVLLPCHKLDPIEPPLRIDEYEMMQRDKTKCENCVLLILWLAS